PGGPGPNYQLVVNNLSMLHGSAANAARVRVIASDGYNTTVATSPAFTLPNQKPVAAILDPSAGTFQDPQLPVSFEGMGTDAEDGALTGTKLRWRVNGAFVGSDTNLVIAGIAPGTWPVTLEARDAQNQLGSDAGTLVVSPLSIPQAGGATLDGLCDDANYANAAQVTLKPYGTGLAGAASVRLRHDGTNLWACFSGLKRGAESPVAYAGLRFDVDESRDATAQPNDFGFFVQENGGAFSRQGNGGGLLTASGPAGMQAQSVGDPVSNTWSAEMRIPGSLLGGLNHIVGMMAGHEDVSASLDDYRWPHATPTLAGEDAPNTWGRTVLGLLPFIGAIDPISFTVGAPDVTLVIDGANFAPGARVLWNGVELTPALTSAVAAAAPVTAESA
ncbi:MAG: hypothetical protein ACRC1H_13915, partial [Caldilineaceae bacterium]